MHDSCWYCQRFFPVISFIYSGQNGGTWVELKRKSSSVQSVCATDRLLNEVRQIAAALSESWLDNSSPRYSMLGITW